MRPVAAGAAVCGGCFWLAATTVWPRPPQRPCFLASPARVGDAVAALVAARAPGHAGFDRSQGLAAALRSAKRRLSARRLARQVCFLAATTVGVVAASDAVRGGLFSESGRGQRSGPVFRVWPREQCPQPRAQLAASAKKRRLPRRLAKQVCFLAAGPAGPFCRGQCCSLMLLVAATTVWSVRGQRNGPVLRVSHARHAHGRGLAAASAAGDVYLDGGLRHRGDPWIAATLRPVAAGAAVCGGCFWLAATTVWPRPPQRPCFLAAPAQVGDAAAALVAAKAPGHARFDRGHGAGRGTAQRKTTAICTAACETGLLPRRGHSGRRRGQRCSSRRPVFRVWPRFTAAALFSESGRASSARSPGHSSRPAHRRRLPRRLAKQVCFLAAATAGPFCGGQCCSLMLLVAATTVWPRPALRPRCQSFPRETCPRPRAGRGRQRSGRRLPRRRFASQG